MSLLHAHPRKTPKLKTGQICLCAAMILALAACVSTEKPGNASPVRSLVILHTNDFHARTLPDKSGRGGAANMAAFIKSVRQRRCDILVLDAGDMTQGSPVSTIYKGEPIFEIYNEIGYDAATLGNHEFDCGIGMIDRYRAIADFPILTANLERKGRPIGDAPAKVFTVNGVRIAVIGLTTHQAIYQKDLTILRPEEALGRYLPQLREKADLIVVLSHLGVERDRELAASVPEIDLIVGGHSHTVIPTPETVGRTLIVQAGEHGKNVGELTLEVDTESDRIVSSQGRLVAIPVEGLAPDPDTDRLVQSWEARVKATVDVKIGVNAKAQSIPELTRAIGLIWKNAYGTDFGLQNSGGTRARLEAGDILVRDIYNILPFDNTITILQLTRAQAAEEIDGAQFAENKELYSVATNSYQADRLIEKYQIPEARIRRLPDPHRDAVIAFVKKHGHLDLARIESPAVARARAD